VPGEATVDRYLRSLEPDAGDVYVRFDGLERAFIAVARRFSEQSGVSYAAWRDVGVSATVLARAGIADA